MLTNLSHGRSVMASLAGYALAAMALMTGSVTASADNDVYHPRLTPETVFMQKNIWFDTLEKNPVSEGIFAIQEYNRNIGSSMYFGFWTIDGKCLFEPQYEMADGQPVFDSGAVVVKGPKNSKGFKPMMILYADGSARELPESYKEVSQFHDGIAVVRTGGMGVKKAECFCIDTQGNRKWNLGAGDVMEVGYLRDGLRYVKFRTEPSQFRYVTRWGFIDDTGKWVIRPTLKEARAFRNGYALVVSENDKLQFIDTAGKVVYEFTDGPTTLQYAKEISDVSDGYFMRRVDAHDYQFFDLNGNSVARFAQATGFTDGYAFVRKDADGPIYVVDTQFRIVRRLFGVNLQSGRVLLGADNPRFGPAGLGTIDKSKVVTPDGRMVISGNPNTSRIGDFAPGEYAPCEAEMLIAGTREKLEYTGYINNRGEFEVVFCDNPRGGGPFEGGITDPVVRDTIPKIRRPLPPPDTIPLGPRDIVTAKYNVRVIAHPAEGGKVAGGGTYCYGDTVTVGARANEGWMLTDISSDNRFSATRVVNQFVVRGDMDITVYFAKEEDVLPVGTGAFIGAKGDFDINDVMPEGNLSIPVYLELSADSDISTPYGDHTPGFLAIMVDPDTPMAFKGKPRTYNDGATVAMNIFFVPMKVSGQVEENGRKYLLLDGGVMKTNNTRVLQSGAKAADTNALETIMFNFMLMFDGADVTIPAGAYRVEMNDIGTKTGAFTFGKLQRFDPQQGWIPAGSEAFESVSRGFFITKCTRGFDADFLNGIRMQPTSRRSDILWTPTPGFFEGDKTMLDNFAGKLGENFRTFQSEYDILKGLDMQSINAAYDRLIK